MVAIRTIRPGEAHLRTHYADLSHRPFFNGLVKYMDQGPVVAMCWEGENAVKTGRVMLGETNPRDSKPGTIRGDFCIQVGRNIIHGSDAVESAQHEINLWFSPRTCPTGLPLPPRGSMEKTRKAGRKLQESEEARSSSSLINLTSAFM